MDFDDPIFSLKSAVPPMNEESDLCRLSKLPAEKSCDFCGYKASEDCLYKKRKFQVNKNVVTNEISIATGEICKICDRKFIMKTIFKKFSELYFSKGVSVSPNAVFLGWFGLLYIQIFPACLPAGRGVGCWCRRGLVAKSLS